MSTNLFFDTGALQLLLIGDPRLVSLKDQVARGRSKAFTSMVNMVELYYKTAERLGKQVADTWYWRVLKSDVQIIKELSTNTGMTAGNLKLKYKGTLSLVDAVCVALSLDLGCTLLTTDGGIKDARESCKVIHFPVK